MERYTNLRPEDQPEIIESFCFPIDGTHEILCSRMDFHEDRVEILNTTVTLAEGLALTENSFPIIGQVDEHDPFHFYLSTYWTDIQKDRRQDITYRSTELFIHKNGSISSTETRDTNNPHEAFQYILQSPQCSPEVPVIICPKGSFKMGISIANTAIPKKATPFTSYDTPTPRDFAVIKALGFPVG